MPEGNEQTADTHRLEMMADLERLVEALDRRVPRLERLGEARIAGEAAELREKALALIAKLAG